MSVLESLLGEGIISNETARAAVNAGEGAWLLDLQIPLPISKSSCIATATYAIRTGTLAINFSNGNSATYPDTSVITVILLCRAESAGSYFNYRLALLITVEFRWPAHVNASRLCPGSAFARACPDQLAFELSKPAEHGEHQASVRRRGVRPCIRQRTEASAALRDGVERVEQIACGSRQPIQPRHHQ